MVERIIDVIREYGALEALALFRGTIQCTNNFYVIWKSFIEMYILKGKGASLLFPLGYPHTADVVAITQIWFR